MIPELPRSVGRWDRHYDATAAVALLVMAVVGLLTWQDFGITWDETYHLDYGDHILAFYTTGFEDKSALTFRIDYLYGGGFDLTGALFRQIAKPLDRWDAIHLMGTMVGILGLGGTWKLGRVLGGPRAGLLALLFMGATSVYWGHMPNNPKDLPFAVGYVWGMAFLLQAVRTFPRVPAGLAVKLAIAMGLAMSVRIGGLLLVCYLGVAIAAWVAWHGLLRRDVEATYRYGKRLVLTGIAVAAGAWAVMLVWWPWALYDPIERPLAALRRMSQFMDHERKMPFAGELVSNYDVDWRYLPHYFWYKLPEFVIVLFLVGTVVGLGLVLWRIRRVRSFIDNLVLGLLGLSLWFPWLYAVYKGSVLYDGLRHFLFLVPVMVAAVAWLVSSLVTKLVTRFGPPAAIGSAAVIGALCIDQYATMVRLHPHEYVYFNRFIGGLAGAVDQYDTDYYAETYGEASEGLARQLWLDDPAEYLDTMYRVAGCGGSRRIMRRLPSNFVYRKGQNGEYDLWIGYTRQNCHRRHPDSPIVYQVTRDDAVLNVARDVRKRIVLKAARPEPRQSAEAHARATAAAPQATPDPRLPASRDEAEAAIVRGDTEPAPPRNPPAPPLNEPAPNEPDMPAEDSP
jgi:hypothetical protein